ncbi:unnamed protein product, partial [marine sediment metagenome]
MFKKFMDNLSDALGMTSNKISELISFVTFSSALIY